MTDSDWPGRADFAQAIRYPKQFLADRSLVQAKVELSPLGLPTSWSGQFAIVFKLRAGSEDWAVRCFISAVSDHQQRYAALSDAISNARSSDCLVRFAYNPKGILIRGAWYPILKMAWADGEP